MFLEDRRNPIYAAVRVGRAGEHFYMYKIRSMRVNADSTGVESTSENDPLHYQSWQIHSKAKNR